VTNRKPLIAVCGVLAVVFVIVGVVYFTKTAADLPSFFPGHDAHSTKHHVKHGIAMVGLAILSLVGAWMLSGPQQASGR
jgi:amino acid permease